MVIIFDAANTLIHKPTLYVKYIEILWKHNMKVELSDLMKNHTLLLNAIEFPDTTSKEFYRNFNKEVLYSLGILPTDSILDDLFLNCSYLEWEVFKDTEMLEEIPYEMGIASNFNKSLNQLLDKHFPDKFKYKLISEELNYRKPDIRFYEQLLEDWKLNPKEILYVGDSIKLDIEPAIKLGINSYLIDRENYFPFIKNRLSSLSDLPDLIKKINE